MSQYELEPSIAYFGTYVDDIITGSFTKLTAGASDVLRGKVASNVYPNGIFSGSSGLFFTAKTLGDYFYYQTSSFVAQKTIIRSVSLFSTRQIYDSLLPSIDDVMATDSGQLVLTSVPTPGISYTRYRYFFGGTYTDPITGSSKTYTITSSLGEQISNNVWLTSFPFQNRYKSLIRKPSGLDNLLSKTYQYTGSFGSVPGSTQPRFSNAFTPARNVTGSIDTAEAPLGGFWGAGTRPLQTFPFANITYILPTGSDTIAANSNDLYVGIEDYEGTVTSGGGFTGYPTIAGVTPTATGSSMYKTTIKHLYGFGVGPRNIVLPLSGGFYFLQTSPHRVGVGARIVGWKYGLYSGFLSSPNCKYRIGKFGQFRDMFEQRIYTKEVSSDFRTTDSPIKIEFIVGTQDYLTASSPLTLNSRDSGIYDIEYRSGQPYQE